MGQPLRIVALVEANQEKVPVVDQVVTPEATLLLEMVKQVEIEALVLLGRVVRKEVTLAIPTIGGEMMTTTPTPTLTIVVEAVPTNLVEGRHRQQEEERDQQWEEEKDRQEEQGYRRSSWKTP
jgi:hypothetical protein